VTVSEFGERRLIARIRARLEAATGPVNGLVVGIGDDAAVVAPGRNAQTVLTTDSQVEGVHFERRFSSPRDIGHRALAVNLSDLAAMGSSPRWALLSLALPAAFEVGDVDGIVDGLAALAAVHRITVIGGNLARSPGPLVVDMTAIGEVGPRRVLTRHGGRPGDELYVSGSIGAAAAGLEMLRARAQAHGRPEGELGPRSGELDANDAGIDGDAASCVARYLRPEPRVRLGVAVGRARAARAAIDLSDGLAEGARQLAEASECGVELVADALPVEIGARSWWEASARDALVAALSGGDDYELLLAVPRSAAGRLRQARSRVSHPPLTRIGVLTKDRAQVLIRNGRREPLPAGYEHY
jgi:thiamine-monophosphate kinase